MSHTRRSFAKSVAALAVLAALSGAACSDSSTGPKPASAPAAGAATSAIAVAGTYVLQAIDGNALPYTADDGTVWDAMTLTLTSDGKASFAVQWRAAAASDEEAAQEHTDSEDATYITQGAHLNFAFVDDDPAEGVLDGDTLTLNSEGKVYVLKRSN
jgi:hypothetical protein